MPELDARLGVRRGRWPLLDLHGQPYQRASASTLSLGGGYFCVLPLRGALDEAALGELKALIAPDAPPLDETTLPAGKKAK